jgi:hypothetical protein
VRLVCSADEAAKAGRDADVVNETTKTQRQASSSGTKNPSTFLGQAGSRPLGLKWPRPQSREHRNSISNQKFSRIATLVGTGESSSVTITFAEIIAAAFPAKLALVMEKLELSVSNLA